MNGTEKKGGHAQRIFWVRTLERLCLPVYSNLARGTLSRNLPVGRGQKEGRTTFALLEALGRSLAGIGPWLQCEGLDTDEEKSRHHLLGLVRTSLANATDPVSTDYANFSQGSQPLVDAAFLALGLLRSKKTVWDTLEEGVQKNIITALKKTRPIQPGFNNWLLFSAIIEVFLCRAGEDWDAMRIDYALRQHEQWYKGDGTYGDGPAYHADYYNSFVIQPMLLEIMDSMEGRNGAWKEFRLPLLDRARRYAGIQERLIGTDGTFPPLGRSLTYRSGAFQHLAVMALREDLPEGIVPSQVRCALTAVMEKTLEVPGTFDEEGWLTLGLSGCQPSLAEGYISTGSLYLCTCSLLPLGLPPGNIFWSGRDAEWTARKIWSGQDDRADHALPG